MSTFDEDEGSREQSEPREFFDISINGTVTYRHTSGIRDMFVAPYAYTAIPIERSSLTVVGAGKQGELEITLPLDHALCHRYTEQGVPPKRITVTLWRKQMVSGLIERLWVGDITSMACEGDGVAKFRVPARAGEALLRVIPNVTASRKCPHILYDAMCRVDRAGSDPDAVPYKLTTTVISVSGRDVRIDLSNVPADSARREQWAINGEIVHAITGDSTSIRAQTDLSPGFSTVTLLSLALPIVGMKIGDSVDVYAGCAWDEITCDEKFDNLSRYGGYPYMPFKNPFTPGFPIEEA